MDSKFDVFIAGAGPVGLYFAYQMIQFGHSVYICDKGKGPTTQSRAILITSRTVETLANRGIAHHFLSESIMTPGVQVFSAGRKAGTINAVGDTPFPHWTCLPQNRTERIFERLLPTGTIRREAHVVGYQQYPDHVEVSVRDRDGNTSIVHARYLVAADGAHSAIRKSTPGWTFDGYSVATRFAMADAVLDGKDAEVFMNERVNSVSHPNGAAAIIPLGRETPGGPYRHRVVCNLDPYELLDAEKESVTHGVIQESVNTISLDMIEKVINERIKPLEIKLRDQIWMSLFKVNERKANGYRRGRVFVMGDAAHCHSPVGGQGMNLGIQDAENLAWKLSVVLRGASSNSDALLDSYSAEREPVAAATLKTTGTMTRYGFSNNFLVSTLTYYAVAAALSFERIQANAVINMMQLNLQISKESPLLLRSSANLIQSGTYLPETITLRRRAIDEIQRKTLREILAGPTADHALILVCARPSRYAPCTLVSEFWSLVKEMGPRGARPVVIESTWHVHHNTVPAFAVADDKDAFWTEDHWDAEHSVTKRVGLDKYLNVQPTPPCALVVVRPDLYVAQSTLIHSQNEIKAALELLRSYLI